jgi:hypothetical protein
VPVAQHRDATFVATTAASPCPLEEGERGCLPTTICFFFFSSNFAFSSFIFFESNSMEMGF